MINDGKRVAVFSVEKWISFGDPFELDIYFYWADFFAEREIARA